MAHLARANTIPNRVGYRATTLIRIAACSAFACLSVHVALAVVGGAGLVSRTAPMLALSGICAMCGVSAWGRPTRRASAIMALGGTTMVLIHVVVMHGSAHEAMHVVDGSMAPAGASGPGGLAEILMHVGVTIAGLQALVALVARMASRGPLSQGGGPSAGGSEQVRALAQLDHS